MEWRMEAKWGKSRGRGMEDGRRVGEEGWKMEEEWGKRGEAGWRIGGRGEVGAEEG